MTTPTWAPQHNEHGALNLSDWLSFPEAEHLLGTDGLENETWEWLGVDTSGLPTPESVSRSTFEDLPFIDYCPVSTPNPEDCNETSGKIVSPPPAYTSPPLTAESPESLESLADGDEGGLHNFLCANNCSGNFIGLHECFRHKDSLIISCSTCGSAFRTRNSFTRHYNTVHRKLRVKAEKLTDCPVTGCKRVGERGFKRRDNLLQHRRGFHGEDIPKVFMRFGCTGLRHRELKVAKVVAKGGV